MIQQRSNEKQLRDFGLINGAMFALFFGLLLPIVKHHKVPSWPFVVSIVSWALALLCPRLLRYPYAAWLRIGAMLGRVNTSIVMGLIFFLVVAPMGLAARLFGYDPMTRRFNQEVDSYRIRSRETPVKNMERPF